MSSQPGPPPSDGPPDPDQARAESPVIAEVQQLISRSYTASSPDGRVTVIAGGDQRLREVNVHDPEVPAGLLGQSLTSAVNGALAQARRATVEGMRELPSIPPEVRALLGGGGT